MREYGNELGLSVDWLMKNKNKSLQDVIESASRPGYGSEKLLIEFIDSPDDGRFSRALKEFFKECRINVIKKNESFDDILYSLSGECGNSEHYRNLGREIPSDIAHLASSLG